MATTTTMITMMTSNCIPCRCQCQRLMHGPTPPSVYFFIRTNVRYPNHPTYIHSPEIIDFGYPQNSETDTLKMYITTESVKSEQAVVSQHEKS